MIKTDNNITISTLNNIFSPLWMESSRQLFSLKEYRCPPEWEIKNRVQHDCYLMYVLKGEGCCVIDGHAQFFSERDLLIYPEGAEQNMAAREKLHVVCLHTRWVWFGTDLFGFLKLAGVFRDEKNTWKNHIKQALSYLKETPVLSQALGEGILTHILCSLLLDRGEKSPLLAKPLPHRGNSSFLSLLNYIDHNCEKGELSVSLLAHHASMSEGGLRKRFHQFLGMTPHAYLTERRLDRASLLLRTTEETIEVIALMSGFSGPEIFHRIFKQQRKITPGEYRRRYLQEM